LRPIWAKPPRSPYGEPTEVSEVIANLIAEFDLTLGLCGAAGVNELGADVLVPGAAADSRGRR